MCYAMERMEENKKRHKLCYAKLAPIGAIQWQETQHIDQVTITMWLMFVEIDDKIL